MSLEYVNSVAINPEHATQALEWAKKNCPSYVTQSWCSYRQQFVFYFVNGKEKTLFALRWV